MRHNAFQRSRDEVAVVRSQEDEDVANRPAADHIRQLVLARGGVTEAEAEILLATLDRLHEIERTLGAKAAGDAARAVKMSWLF